MNHQLHLKTLFLVIIVFAFCSEIFAVESNDLDCLIKPEMYVELGSSADGILESIAVEKSDIVSKGQPVAKLESSVEAATVELARQKAGLEDDIKAKQIHMAFTKRKSARLAKLYKKNAISFNDKDEADTEAAMAVMDLRKAKSDKKIAELELNRAIARLEQRTIKSPIAGVVIEQMVMPGEAVDDRPILKLAQIDPLKVEVLAPTEMFGALSKGMRAEIIPEVPANKVYKATINVVDKVIDPASGSFLVRLKLPNPDYQVVGGLKCKIHFLAENGAPIGIDTLMNIDPLDDDLKPVGDAAKFKVSSK